MKNILSAISIVWLCAVPVFAGDFEDGIKAARGGQYDIALKKWDQLASDGHPGAKYEIGRMYYDGLGTKRDYPKAKQYFAGAATLGHPDAIFSLGQMYDFGRSVDPDYYLAVKWYRAAANFGHKKANLFKVAEKGNKVLLYSIGLMYSAGRGFPKDKVKAYVWWSYAARLGHKSAIKRIDALNKELTEEQIVSAGEISKKLKHVE